jgi:carbon-monoxide dehydrogenase medium subunit
MTPFEWAEPKSLREAVALLDTDDPTVRPMAGGTALMLMMKAGVFRPSKLVSLAGLTELVSIGSTSGELKIGAMTPLAALEKSDAVKKHAPVIPRARRTLSNIRGRKVATVGGALAHADPHMDLPPVLIALGARVNVVGKSGERTIPVADLFAGYYETVLAKDELISSLVVPPLNGRRAVYHKVTTRAVHDWPALGVAVSVSVDGKAIRDAAIVVSAATEKPARLGGAEQAVRGASDDPAFRRAGDAAADEAELITDAQGSAAYKKQLLRVTVARALRAVLGAQ